MAKQKGPRRGRGEGSIEELPSGKFRVVFSIGKTANPVNAFYRVVGRVFVQRGVVQQRGSEGHTGETAYRALYREGCFLLCAITGFRKNRLDLHLPGR